MSNVASPLPHPNKDLTIHHPYRINGNLATISIQIFTRNQRESPLVHRARNFRFTFFIADQAARQYHFHTVWTKVLASIPFTLGTEMEHCNLFVLVFYTSARIFRKSMGWACFEPDFHFGFWYRSIFGEECLHVDKLLMN